MIPRPAISAPRPLPRERGYGNERAAITLASVGGKAVASSKRGRPPAKTIQRGKATLARRKAIQTNEAMAARQGKLARVNALRIQIRTLVIEIPQAADVYLLNLMVDKVGSYVRHKAAQDAGSWAATARMTLETRLMQLCRALPESINEDGIMGGIV